MTAIDVIGELGSSDARRLRQSGIRTTAALLRQAATIAGRRELASRLALEEDEILQLAFRIDLMRIKGMGVLYCELLSQIGVHTIEDLRTWNPDTLRAMIVQANGRFGLARRLPNLHSVAVWIIEARTLDSIVER